MGSRSRALTARPRGFSIIELAVVFIILGVTITLTLKGTVLIDVMKAVIAGYEVQLYQRRTQLYAAQFHYLPGDDPKAASRFGHPEASRNVGGAKISSVGDNKLDGKFLDLANDEGEQIMAWRDMRYARLLDGDPTLTGAAAMPNNPWGGSYGFDEGNLGHKKGSICLNKVPGEAAKRMDASVDDGVINQGEVVATSRPDNDAALGHYDAPDSQPYDVEKTYIICASLPP